MLHPMVARIVYGFFGRIRRALTVSHRVAVRTNGAQVLDRVNFLVLFYRGERY